MKMRWFHAVLHAYMFFFTEEASDGFMRFHATSHASSLESCSTKLMEEAFTVMPRSCSSALESV